MPTLYVISVQLGDISVISFSKVVPEHNAMKAYWGNGGIAPLLL